MQLMDLLDKDQKIQVKILVYFLRNEKTIKVKELAEQIDVSYPTLQKGISTLTHSLQDFDQKAVLAKKNSDFLQLDLPNDFSVKKFLYTYLEQAINYNLLTDIYQEKEISITKLAFKNNLSEASIFRRLKTINRLLAEFDLQFKNKKLYGSELQIQFFYFQLFKGAIPESHLKMLVTDPSIKNLMQVIEDHFHFQFNKRQNQLLSLRLHILQRRLDYRQVPKQKIPVDMMKQLEQDPFYQELKNIMTRFLSRFALSETEYEAVYLFLFFISEGLLPQKSKWWKLSALVQYFLSINKKIYQIITEEKGYDPTFAVFLLQNHIKIAFYNGEIIFNEQRTLLLSDIDSQTMNQCMSVVEKKLSRDVSHAQWEMLDHSYGLIWDIYQRRQQKELLVGVVDDESLQAAETFRFIKQSLAGMSHIIVEKAENRRCDLLIAFSHSDVQEFDYKSLYLLTGTLSSFEEQRLKQAAKAMIEGN